MARQKPPVTWASLLTGQRDWSLLGAAGAGMAIVLALVLLSVGLLLGLGWATLAGVVVLVLCLGFIGYAVYNMTAANEADRHQRESSEGRPSTEEGDPGESRADSRARRRGRQ